MTQISPTAPQVLVSNVVQLVNEGPEKFRMKYGTIFFELEAGASMFVNEEVAWHFLGRWWTDNSNPRQRDRANEYSRLRVLYGAYEDDRMWEASRARWLKAYAPDGQLITTVVDDPEGTSTTGGQTPFGHAMSLESQIEVMRQQMQQLIAENEASKRREADEGQPTIPKDSPPQPQTPYNPAAPPAPVPNVAGVPVPVSPAAFGVPSPEVDPDADELGTFGQTIPVAVTVAYDPAEADVPEDAPAVVKHGPTGGRVAP